MIRLPIDVKHITVYLERRLDPDLNLSMCKEVRFVTLLTYMIDSSAKFMVNHSVMLCPLMGAVSINISQHRIRSLSHSGNGRALFMAKIFICQTDDVIETPPDPICR